MDKDAIWKHWNSLRSCSQLRKGRWCVFSKVQRKAGQRTCFPRVMTDLGIVIIIIHGGIALAWLIMDNSVVVCFLHRVNGWIRLAICRMRLLMLSGVWFDTRQATRMVVCWIYLFTYYVCVSVCVCSLLHLSTYYSPVEFFFPQKFHSPSGLLGGARRMTLISFIFTSEFPVRGIICLHNVYPRLVPFQPLFSPSLQVENRPRKDDMYSLETIICNEEEFVWWFLFSWRPWCN